MDEALVEDAEDDVDDDERRGDQTGSLDSEAWKAWAFPWKVGMIEGGMPSSARRRGDGIDRLAERDAGLQVERQRDGGELPLMRHLKRPGLARSRW